MTVYHRGWQRGGRGDKGVIVKRGIERGATMGKRKNKSFDWEI